jgi:predicted permease
MLIIMFIAVICYKAKVLNQAANEALSNLLLLIVNPFIIIMAYQVPYESRLVKGLLISFGLAFVVHFMGFGIANIFIRKSETHSGLDRYAAAYGNCGFMGIPLVASALGVEGVLYLTGFLGTFNILCWTHGAALLKNEKLDKKEMAKGLLTPTVVATVIGIILFFCRVRFPEMISGAFQYVADMNTALAMFIAGLSIAQADIKNIYKKFSMYRNALLKLVILPLLTLALLVILHIPNSVGYVILIAAACPTATSITGMAIMYKQDYKYGSELFSTSTILSMITLPFIVLLGEYLM